MSLRISCPVCNSRDTRIFHRKVWSYKKGRVYRCASCDLAFLYPAMTGKEEKRFYAHYDTHMKKRLSFSPPGGIGKSHVSARAAAAERFAVVKGLFKGARTALEIGSSTGAFLETLKNAGFSRGGLTGIEPCRAHREYSRRVTSDVYGDISELPAGRKFDIICMFHVFEHIARPALFLRECKRHLKNKGRMLIEVPFIQDPLISLYDSSVFKDFYFQPMHPYVHSLGSLRHIFLRSGFRETKAIYYQRYGLDNHLAWLSKGKPGGDRNFARLFAGDRFYKDALEKTGTTDTLFYAAEYFKEKD